MARLFRLIHALQGECSAEGFLDVGRLPLTDPPAKTVVESINKCVQGNLLDERLAIGVDVGIRSGSEKGNVVGKGAQRLTLLATTGAELCPMQADAFRGGGEIVPGERHAVQRSRRGWLLASPGQDAELDHEDEPTKRIFLTSNFRITGREP